MTRHTLRLLLIIGCIASPAAWAFSATTALRAPRDTLLDLVQSAPKNLPTGRSLTDDILATVRQLEQNCPTKDADVSPQLGGTWELIWTAQDPQALESYAPWSRLTQPLENQARSNNPNGGRSSSNSNSNAGRLDPVLPRELQDQLERAGLLVRDDTTPTVRSTQFIDVTNRRLKNSVVLPVPGVGPVAVTMNIQFRQDLWDYRKVLVRFQDVTCSKLNLRVPFGVFGPVGWLRTVYLDETLRISRGHKGSVFVLRRKSRKKRAI